MCRTIPALQKNVVLLQFQNPRRATLLVTVELHHKNNITPWGRQTHAKNQLQLLRTRGSAAESTQGRLQLCHCQAVMTVMMLMTSAYIPRPLPNNANRPLANEFRWNKITMKAEMKRMKRMKGQYQLPCSLNTQVGIMLYIRSFPASTTSSSVCAARIPVG